MKLKMVFGIVSTAIIIVLFEFLVLKDDFHLFGPNILVNIVIEFLIICLGTYVFAVYVTEPLIRRFRRRKSVKSLVEDEDE